MTDIFLMIANMSISAGWIILGLLLLRIPLRKAPKWIWVALWGIVAVRLVCPFSIESVLSLIPSAETISPEIMVEASPTINTGIPVINEAVNPIIIGTFSPAPMASANPLQIFIPIASGIWLLGVGIMLLYTAITYICLRRKVCTAVRLRDSVYQCETVVSPFVLGIIKPTIYLSFSMDAQDMEYVIAHENAHIRRKDHLWKPFGFLLLALHWFNPLMWLGYVLLCRDIELACDEKVIKELSGQQKADYSQALLKCSVNRRSIAACPLAFGEVGVENRVKSVLKYKKPAFWIVLVAILVSIAAAVCFLTDPVTDKKEDWYSKIQKERIHTYSLVEDEKAGQTVKKLVVTEKASGREIQTIYFDENEWSIEEPLYIDITFDGNADIVVPHQQASSGIFYLGYIWDGEAGQYVHAPTLEELPNIALDTENGMILCHRTADKITGYSMYKYNTGTKDFAVARNLGWEPEGNSLSIRVTESAYTETGEREVVQQFSAKTADGLFPDRTDSQMSPYYSEGSVWDLDGEKWNATIAGQSMLLTEEASVLLRVLNSEKAFISESGEYVYLKDYELIANREMKAVPEKFALVDFDGDGKDELIAYVTPEFGAYLVFRIDKNKVYGFEFGVREITDLKADGSFIASEGAAIFTYYTLSFEKGKYIFRELAYYNGTDGVGTYRIDGKTVAPEEMYTYNEKFRGKTSAAWVEYGNSKTEDYKNLYQSFLSGEITAWQDGKDRTLISYFHASNFEDTDFSYTYCDMTGDGIPELCVRNFATYIFTIRDGQVHHWCTDSNVYSELLNNGAFLYERHGGAPTHINYEYYVLDANANETFRVTFSWWDGKNIEQGKEYPDVYIFNDQEVTKEEYEAKTRQYLEIGKDRIVWYDKDGNIRG